MVHDRVHFLLDRGEAVSRKHISESLDFLFLEHEVSFPVGDIKAAPSPGQLENQLLLSISPTQKTAVTHMKTTHLSLSSHIFPLERCRPHLTPSVLVFFLIFHAVLSLSLRATLTFLPAPKLIFSSLFL